MKILKNPEIAKTLLSLSIIGVVAVVVAFFMEMRFGVLVFFLFISFVTVYLVSEKKRYKKISYLSESINNVLHGDDKISIENYSEGELGILQSEIHKLVVRLREQQHTLQNDKIFLADSIADISHQIRTPLTSVNLLVSFISEPDISDERREKLSRDLYSLLSRMEWLIVSLLKISKLDAGTIGFKKQEISMEEFIKKSVSPILVPIELRNQKLEITSDGNFYGDIHWTSEAIVNIVKNCMEHTDEGGMIKIEATENVLYTEIIISDNGSGIQKEDLPHIFERFYRSGKQDDNSYGIGLALARMIVSAQNGTIRAENISTGGARFIMRFYKCTV